MEREKQFKIDQLKCILSDEKHEIEINDYNAPFDTKDVFCSKNYQNGNMSYTKYMLNKNTF